LPNRKAIVKGTAMEHDSEPTPIASSTSLTPSGLGNGALSPRTLGLVSCGAIGAVLFTATYLLEGSTRPGYDALQQPISALSLGPGGWVQQVNFVVFGVLLVLSAVGWYRVLMSMRGAIWFPLLQGIGGLCLIGAGVSSMDPFPGYPPGATLSTSTAQGTLHSIFAWVLILCLAQSCFALAANVRFARIPRWRWWEAYSYLAGVLMLVFWGMFVKGAPGPFGGLYERLSAGSRDLWLCVVTAALVVHYWIKNRPSARGGSAQGSL
jgi:hypothetical protein